VHFAFDEQQLEFRAQLRAFAEKECTPADVREAWASPSGWSRRRWAGLADMGVVGLTVPAEHGGLGLGLVDLVLLLEEAGRAGVPEPVLETAALAVPALAAVAPAVVPAASGSASAPSSASAELAAHWLARVAAGGTAVAVGTASMVAVPGTVGADLLLLEHAGALHAVAAEAVTLEPQPVLDGSRRLARVQWQPSPATVVASGAAAEGVLAGIGERAAMGTGALLVGVADRLVAMAAQYAGERVQFGKPIGSFQAVKHHLADALVRVEFARPAVYRAAWSLQEGDPDAGVHASMAKALSSEAALLAARTALQVHGAIGYTWEHDLQLWMKRAWSLAAAWGDAAAHRARVLEALLARR
jgi:alkylation response protein AidB-like acyl-CoA dehydrogenase